MKKLLLVVGASVAAGYLLGTRAGRQRYEQIKTAATRVKDDPRVQDATHQVAEVVKHQAPVVKEKVGAAAGAAMSKVKSSSGDDAHSVDAATPEALSPEAIPEASI